LEQYLIETSKFDIAGPLIQYQTSSIRDKRTPRDMTSNKFSLKNFKHLIFNDLDATAGWYESTTFDDVLTAAFENPSFNSHLLAL